MRTLLLAPHSDDEILFAAYTIAANPGIDVLIVAQDPDPGAAAIRWRESRQACSTMGTDSVEYLGVGQVEGHLDGSALWHDLDVLRAHVEYERVFAPAEEENGHPEHSLVGRVAAMAWPTRTTHYLTYTRTHGRSTLGDEVFYETDWIVGKLRALSEFRSQIDHPARRPWFYDLIDLREWYA